MGSLLPTLFLGLAALLAVNPDHYRDETRYMLGVSILWLGAIIWKRVHWSAAMLFIWTTVEAVFRWNDPNRFPGSFDPKLLQKMAFDSLAAETTGVILLVTLVVLFMGRKQLTQWVNAFSWLSIASAIKMFFDRKCGVLDNPSQDASFLACLLPLTLFRPDWKMPWNGKSVSLRPLGLLPLAAIFYSSSITGFFAVLVCLGAYGYTKIPKAPLHHRVIQLLFALGVAALLAQVPAFHHKFTETNGRWDYWRAAWQVLIDNPDFNIWRGSGTGSFFLIGQGIGKHDRCWMHNDFYQILFEHGFFAFAASAILFAQTAKRAREPWLYASVLTYGLTMQSQMPLRHVASSLFAAVLIRLAFFDDAKEI